MLLFLLNCLFGLAANACCNLLPRSLMPMFYLLVFYMYVSKVCRARYGVYVTAFVMQIKLSRIDSDSCGGPLRWKLFRVSQATHVALATLCTICF